MTEEICDVKMQQKAILELLEEVKVLWIQNAEKGQRLLDKERRVEASKQYSHINDPMCMCVRGGNAAPL